MTSDFLSAEKRYNVEEFLRFLEIEAQKPGNENTRYELIDGVIYMMAYPSVTHYNVCKFIEKAFEGYFSSKGCTVINGSVALFLFDEKSFAMFDQSEGKDYVGPDLMVICDKDTRIKNDGIHGAPEIIVEVISKSNARHDYIRKLNTYFAFGVKEYWIVDPIKKRIRIYDMLKDDPMEYNYTFDHVVRSELFADLYIDFRQFTGFVED